MHSPSPWHVDPDDRPQMEWNNHIYSADGLAVCFMAHSNGRNRQRDEANAALISAAPELLMACEAALNDRMYKEWPAVADLLKAAIKKARCG